MCTEDGHCINGVCDVSNAECECEEGYGGAICDKIKCGNGICPVGMACETTHNKCKAIPQFSSTLT